MIGHIFCTLPWLFSPAVFMGNCCSGWRREGWFGLLCAGPKIWKCVPSSTPRETKSNKFLVLSPSGFGRKYFYFVGYTRRMVGKFAMFSFRKIGLRRKWRQHFGKGLDISEWVRGEWFWPCFLRTMMWTTKDLANKKSRGIQRYSHLWLRLLGVTFVRTFIESKLSKAHPNPFQIPNIHGDEFPMRSGTVFSRSTTVWNPGLPGTATGA